VQIKMDGLPLVPVGGGHIFNGVEVEVEVASTYERDESKEGENGVNRKVESWQSKE
jgi:hypothetical protein